LDERTVKIERGKQADALLDSEVFKEAVEVLKRKNYEAYMASRSPEEREQLWALGQAVILVEEQLKAFRQEGLLEYANKLEESR